MTQVRRPLAIALMLLSAPFAASAGDGDAPASSVSWEVSAVSDYLFRGASQTDEKATLQGTLTWTSASGLYVGSFASGVDFGERHRRANLGAAKQSARRRQRARSSFASIRRARRTKGSPRSR